MITHETAPDMPIYELKPCLGGAGMNPGRHIEPNADTTSEIGRVSGRFLTDFFRSLERNGVPATQLLGDLPIPLDETGRVIHAVDWVDFVDFMKRLEHQMGGKEELEACGAQICELGPSAMIQNLVGLSASPYSLYRAASQWALRRAMPGIQTSIKEVSSNRIEIHVHLAPGLRPCPQLFHLAAGCARALPRILGLSHAVVTAHIEDSEARYQITVPASRTPWARLTRFFKSIVSAGSVLEFLEAQQLELHSKHEELEGAKAALAESERRHRTLTDAAVDVVCELDESGHIVYVSASVMDLMGYTPEQVTGSHFSLWVPGTYRDQARARFEVFATQVAPQTVTRQRVQLHTEAGGHILAELSLRPYRTPEGGLRMVVILRDETDRLESRRPRHSKRPDENQEPDSVRALRESVEKLRSSPTRHPIERSLGLLLASLDTNPGDTSEIEMGRLVSATERMTQIVERAMASSEDPSTHFRWHETEKFGERIASEFHSSAANADREFRIETANSPPLFWGDDELLATGLASLLDWTTEQAEPEVGIRLEVGKVEESTNGVRMLVFSVGTISTENGSNQLDETQPTGGSSTRSNLALATAKDAANALGGDLQLDRIAPGHEISRLRIPQPANPAS